MKVDDAIKLLEANGFTTKAHTDNLWVFQGNILVRSFALTGSCEYLEFPAEFTQYWVKRGFGPVRSL